VSYWGFELSVTRRCYQSTQNLFIFRKHLRRAKYTKNTQIHGKVVVITGANTGIGKETAIDLASRGGKVYIACRDIKRGEDALKEIKERSNSDNIHFLQLDLASLDSVREFSRKFHEVEDQLHILVNNAGIMACPKGKTKDGFELQLGTNHLGHFLLTNLLLDLLKSASPSRVVVVSSEAYKWGTINRDDLMCENSYSKYRAYGQSKLANILFANELGKKLEGTGVTVNSCHPGVVTTELGRFGNQTFKKFLIDPIFSHFMKTPWEGAQTQIYLALDPDLNDVTGKYFLNCQEVTPSAKARDEETASWLFNKSMELVQL
jgi:NAD(P)-dependent dehydrogenase (short-subunit alcohol dehydrogenase family)